MIAIHKAIADTGGIIGSEIGSGNVGVILPKIALAQQTSGVVIYRKFYLKNNNTRIETGTMEIQSSSPFTAIIFQGTSDAQVVGDLTGTEVNGSPIPFTFAVGATQSYWVKITVPALSAQTVNYQTVTLKLTY